MLEGAAVVQNHLLEELLALEAVVLVLQEVLISQPEVAAQILAVVVEAVKM
jgi:hypothetical protein